MDVIVITSTDFIEDEISKAVHLFEHGLKVLHIRKPKLNSREVEDWIKQIPVHYRDRLVVHGHYRLAHKYKLRGVHLQRRHRSDKWRNRWKRFIIHLRSPNLKISTTFHSLQSLRENKTTYDYVLLSNMFTSHSHYSHTESAGINLLRNCIEQSGTRVFASGGVNLERLLVVKSAGFSGVGLSSAVWKSRSEKPEEVLNRYFQA